MDTVDTETMAVWEVMDSTRNDLCWIDQAEARAVCLFCH